MAQADFDEIVEYLVGVAGNNIAADYAERFRASINLLGDFPGIGTPRSTLGSETRVVSVAPYAIFYDGEPTSANVHVLRILHSRRDITPKLIAHGRLPSDR